MCGKGGGGAGAGEGGGGSKIGQKKGEMVKWQRENRERWKKVSDEVMLNVLRCPLAYLGQAVTSAEAWFNIALRPRKPEGSLGRIAQDGHLDSHTAPELWKGQQLTWCFTPSQPLRLYQGEKKKGGGNKRRRKKEEKKEKKGRKEGRRVRGVGGGGVERELEHQIIHGVETDRGHFFHNLLAVQFIHRKEPTILRVFSLSLQTITHLSLDLADWPLVASSYLVSCTSWVQVAVVLVLLNPPIRKRREALLGRVDLPVQLRGEIIHPAFAEPLLAVSILLWKWGKRKPPP